MKKLLLIIGIITSMALHTVIAQNDVLDVIFEFNSPTLNTWGLTFDGTNFWISNNESGWIFNTNQTGQILDSIEVKNSKITGLTMVNDTLWALNTEKITDTVINTSNFPVFCLYQVDKSNGNKLDSIKIIGPPTNLNSGDLWGLMYFNNKFYISFNGGYGSCLFKLSKDGSTNPLCCTHLLGMTEMANSIWAIRIGGKRLVTTSGTDEHSKYIINCNATDITFDGTNLWVVDVSDNKIKKMKAIPTAAINELKENDKIKIYPNPSEQYITINNESTQSINSVVIFDTNGRIIDEIFLNKADNQNINISNLASGEYLITIYLTDKIVTKKFIKK